MAGCGSSIWFLLLPESLKQIQDYLTLANEYEQRHPVICYWCVYHATQMALKLSRSSLNERERRECQSVVGRLVEWLESTKRELRSRGCTVTKLLISNEKSAQPYIEGFALGCYPSANKYEKESFGDK
jgi:hypothetical protein